MITCTFEFKFYTISTSHQFNVSYTERNLKKKKKKVKFLNISNTDILFRSFEMQN